ncbi:MAG: OsmC family protein [Chiayiivirga sp.]|jgi:osmotically inducible protein OsmC|uniref:OsmC family protein n=1 Tax=Chiayiivirga sp. TaxID=2041042 RepID=UPI0025C165BC|nr:OsmC family protein [Chiayiivirga sp.]MCI1709187.1 OsmC family protein [Chiayiivirga sp.]MCI1729197.1 OsmC family protein [Chiayiivirga sp.]
MAFKRYATAYWEGDLKSGKGAMSTPQSGLFDGQRYSYNTRFGEEKGTNPEELLAAAHAGCYSMALGFILQNAGFIAGRIETRAEAAMSTEGGPSVTGIHLVVRATVPGIDAANFAEIADTAKKNCVISRVLSIPVTLDAALA